MKSPFLCPKISGRSKVIFLNYWSVGIMSKLKAHLSVIEVPNTKSVSSWAMPWNMVNRGSNRLEGEDLRRLWTSELERFGRVAWDNNQRACLLKSRKIEFHESQNVSNLWAHHRPAQSLTSWTLKLVEVRANWPNTWLNIQAFCQEVR